MTTTLTIQQIIDEWLSSLDVAAISKRSYRVKTQLWFRWLAANRYDPRAPRHSTVIDYKQAMEAAGKSTLTIDSYITAIRLFYGYCDKMGYYTNIVTGIRTATRFKWYRKSALTKETATQLLDSIDTSKWRGRRDKLIIAIMLMIGLRTCEVERINMRDIDNMYGQTIIRIQRKGRTDKSEAIALTPYLCDLLADYIGHTGERSDDAPLFVSSKGKRTRLLRTSISEMVHERLLSIGIDDPKITAHSLRHTCACLMIEEGLDIETVRDMLGHTSTNTTRLYIAQMQAVMLIRNTPSKVVERALNLATSPEPCRMTT